MKHTWIECFESEREQELFDLYSKEWWTEGRQFDDVIRMLRHSDIVLGCCADSGRLVGFGRVLTDFTFKALIFDIIVHAEFRGYGLGRAMVDRIVSHEKLSKVKSFELYCPERLIPFYQRLGFAKGSASLLFLER